MSYGLARMAIGASRGIEQTRQRHREEDRDEMDREKHGLLMDRGKMGLKRDQQVYEHAETQEGRAGDVHERFLSTTDQKIEDEANARKLNMGLLQFEAFGQPDELLRAYNEVVPDGNAVKTTPEGDLDYRVEYDEELGEVYVLNMESGQEVRLTREVMAAMAIEYQKPGTFQAIRNARAEAEAKKAADELLHKRQVHLERVKGDERRKTEEVKNDRKTALGLFGKLRPEAWTPESMDAWQAHYVRTGEFKMSLLQPIETKDPQQARYQQAVRRAGETAKDMLDRYSKNVARFVERHPAEAEAAGVNPEDDHNTAWWKLYDHFLDLGMGEETQQQGGDPIVDRYLNPPPGPDEASPLFGTL